LKGRHHVAHPAGQTHPKRTRHPGHTTRKPGVHHTRTPGHHLPGHRLHNHNTAMGDSHGQRHRHHVSPTGRYHPGGSHGRRTIHQPARHPRKTLISAHTFHTSLGYLHTKTRHKRTRIVVHRTQRAHRVWRRTSSSRRSSRRRL